MNQELSNKAQKYKNYRLLLKTYQEDSDRYGAKIVWSFAYVAFAIFILFFQYQFKLKPGSVDLFFVYIIFVMSLAVGVFKIVMNTILFFRLEKPANPDDEEVSSPPSLPPLPPVGRPKRDIPTYRGGINIIEQVSRPSRVMVVDNQKIHMGSLSLFDHQWKQLHDALRNNDWIWKRASLKDSQVFTKKASGISLTNDDNYGRITKEFEDLGLIKDIGRSGYKVRTKGRKIISENAGLKVLV